MELVLSGADQRKVDRLTMDEFGLPPFTLMENAGRAAAAHINRQYGPMVSCKVGIVCGKGNNGGDGLVVARVLCGQGAPVHVLLLGSPATPEAALNLELLRKLRKADKTIRLTITDWDPATTSLPDADLYVDAILGTGLTRTLRGLAAGAVEQLNSSGKPIAALDVPTGLHADTGTPLGAAVRADMTVTMGALKPGLLINEGPQYSPEYRRAEIGIPRHLIFADSVHRRYWLTTDRGVAQLLPQRHSRAHKYSAGMVLVVGGSPGLTGAPVMASTAAARVGAGYVACATPASIQPIMAEKLTEIAAIGLPEHPQGGLNISAAISDLQPWLTRAGCLLIGPGLGCHPRTRTFVRQLVASVDLPVVIDADGLRALDPDRIAAHSCKRWILTPHWGEFGALVPQPVDPVNALNLAHEWSRKWDSTLILKGMPSTIASPDYDGLICGSGSSALATAGTGDILAGLCAGLVAQGCSPMDAAVCAIHLGGAAADAYSKQYPEVSMMAMDMHQVLPLVLGRILPLRDLD